MQNSKNNRNNFEIVNKINGDSEAVQWLDAADALNFIQRCKLEMRQFCPVQPGQHVLDVGCGVGQEVRRLADVVGGSGSVIGIDISVNLIDEARRRYANQGLSLEFYVGGAEKIQFSDDSFDICRAERVIEYVDDPRLMLSEMVRVTRPGGSLLLFDFDYRGIIVDTTNRALARKINEIVAFSVPNAEIGGALPRLCHELGLVDIRVSPQLFQISFFVYTALVQDAMLDALKQGQLTQAEFDSWWGELRAAENSGSFFATVSGFIVVGCKLSKI